jgi:drug/metabolite transporter (DMT)-like permease
VVGIAYCVASAVFYTAANICLRQLTTLEVDPAWVICIKETVTVGVIGPWLAFQAFRGRPVMPPPRALAALVLTGLAIQLAGNLPMQWSFGVVGIAIALPAVFGVMLTASAVMGWVLLKEAVSSRSMAAIGFLVCSIVLLSAGVATEGAVDYRPGVEAADVAPSPAGGDAPIEPAGDVPVVPRQLSLLWVILGVGASCLAGALFALLTITIRFTATARVPVTSIVFVITGMGVLSLGSLSLGRLGPDHLMATRPEQLAWMVAAGVCNLIAFLAITKGLQMTTVVHANVLNASQVAMGAMAGVLLFHESLNVWSTLGIVLTIVGVVLFRQPEAEQEPELPGV